MFAGWINRRQVDLIEYLKEENRILKERMGGQRIGFTDTERRRLARKAYALGRNVLNSLDTVVTPDTLPRWYRNLIARKWNYSHRRGPGRPRIMSTSVDLIVRMALENRSWGSRSRLLGPQSRARVSGHYGNILVSKGQPGVATPYGEHDVPAAWRSSGSPATCALRHTLFRSWMETLAAPALHGIGTLRCRAEAR